MRNIYQSALKDLLHDKIVNDRKSHHLIQSQMAEMLAMDPRSYFDLESGASMCGTLTFTLYLLEFCENPNELIEEIRSLFENIKNNAE